MNADQNKDIEPIYSQEFDALLKDLEDGKVESIPPTLLAKDTQFKSLIESMQSNTIDSNKEYFEPFLEKLVGMGKEAAAQSFAAELKFSRTEWNEFLKKIQVNSTKRVTQYIVGNSPKKD